MEKIKGSFAPLTQELGEDQRFIVESTDLDKLLYLLIIYTCHMTRHKAPIDPRFYKARFRLRAKSGQIVASMRRLRDLYPKLSWGDKNLSLLNSVTCEIQKSPRSREEKSREEVKGKKITNPSLEDCKKFFKTLNKENEAEVFFDHFTSNGWKVGGKTTMEDWNAAARNWVRRGNKGIIKNPNRKPSPTCKSHDKNGMIMDGQGKKRECWCWK